MSLITHLSWTASSQAIRVVFQFVLSVVLARLLAPDEFGLVALTTIFVGFATLFVNFGLGSAIVQKQNVEDEDLDFVFWLNLVAGASLAVLFYCLAPLIARFYGEPQLVNITRVLSSGILASAFSVIPGSLLLKTFAFHRLAVVEVVTALVSGSLGIFLAFRGYGVYSLVFMNLCSHFLSMVLQWLSVSWRPRFKFRSKSARGLLSYGSGLLGFNSINYWLRNVDNLLIGRFCGAFELGIYGRGYSLLLFPLTQVNQVLSRVMFPTLSSMQHSKDEFRLLYLKACQAIGLVTFPLMIGLVVVADDFVYALYGENWAAAIPVIQVLALAGLGQSVGTTVELIFTAMGRTDVMLKWVLFAAPVLLGSFVIGLPWGAFGVAVAYVVAQYTFLWYPMWRLAGGLIDLKFTVAMKNLFKPFVGAVLMAVCVWLVRIALPTELSSALRLFAQATVGAAAYAIAVHALKVEAYSLLRDRLRMILFRPAGV